MKTLTDRFPLLNSCLVSMLISVSVLLSAQSIETSKSSSTLILKEFDPSELNGDGWAFQPRLQITEPANFILQNHPISIGDLPQKIVEYALLCPPHKRYILLLISNKVSASTLVMFLQALQKANEHFPMNGTQTSSIPITAVIPIDRSTHSPTFPLPLSKPSVKEFLPPPAP